MENESFFDRGFAKVKGVVSDVSIEQRSFIKVFVRTAQEGYELGWHEGNGGNLSYRMSGEEAEACRSFFKETPDEWKTLGVRAEGLRSEFLVVTASGSYFNNLSKDVTSGIGIVEINQTGDAWREVWGFKGGGKPTSEFVGHFMIHAVRKAISDGTNRVVYHAHPENIVALSLVLPADSREFSQVMWKSLTESILLIPQGVGVSNWAVPGSRELAESTSTLMEKTKAVVWPRHGLICAGDTFDQTFGVMQTTEKAAGIYLKARSAAGNSEHLRMISDDELRAAAEAFGVVLNEEFLG